MNRLSRKKLLEKTLPDKKKSEVKIDFISYYIWRPVCDYISIIMMNMSISANAITLFSLYISLLGLCIFIFSNSILGFLIGYTCIFIWNIADGVDGNLARYRNEMTKKGDLLDAVAGYIAMVTFYLGSGIIASKQHITIFDSNTYILLGALSAISTILPRLILQKKQNIYGKKGVESLKEKGTFDIKKIIVLNLISINGLGGLILLISIIFNITYLFVLFYTILQLFFAFFSITILLKNVED